MPPKEPSYELSLSKNLGSRYASELSVHRWVSNCIGESFDSAEIITGDHRMFVERISYINHAFRLTKTLLEISRLCKFF